MSIEACIVQRDDYFLEGSFKPVSQKEYPILVQSTLKFLRKGSLLVKALATCCALFVNGELYVLKLCFYLAVDTLVLNAGLIQIFAFEELETTQKIRAVMVSSRVALHLTIGSSEALTTLSLLLVVKSGRNETRFDSSKVG